MSLTESELIEATDHALAECRSLYRRGSEEFYKGFHSMWKGMTRVNNQRRKYEETGPTLPDHPFEQVVEMWWPIKNKGGKGIPVFDWRALGVLLGEAGGKAGKEKGKGKTVEESDREEGGSKGNGKEKEKERPKPVPLKKTGKEKEVPPPSKGTTKGSKRAHETDDEDPPKTTAAAEPKRKSGGRLIKSKPTVDSEGEEENPAPPPKKASRPAPPKQEEQQSESEEEPVKATKKVKGARDGKEKPKSKRKTAAPAVVRRLMNEESDDRDSVEPLDDGEIYPEEAVDTPPLERAHRRKEATQREKEAARVFHVFGNCAGCTKAEKVCKFTQGRMALAKDKVKVVCDRCKKMKSICTMGPPPGFNLDTPLTEYENLMFPPDKDGKIVRKMMDGETDDDEGRDVDVDGQNVRTVGTLFTTLVKEQRILGQRVEGLREELKEVATGVETSPQHGGGLTSAIVRLSEKVEGWDHQRKETEAMMAKVIRSFEERLEMLENREETARTFFEKVLQKLDDIRVGGGGAASAQTERPPTPPLKPNTAAADVDMGSDSDPEDFVPKKNNVGARGVSDEDDDDDDVEEAFVPKKTQGDSGGGGEDTGNGQVKGGEGTSEAGGQEDAPGEEEQEEEEEEVVVAKSKKKGGDEDASEAEDKADGGAKKVEGETEEQEEDGGEDEAKGDGASEGGDASPAPKAISGRRTRSKSSSKAQSPPTAAEKIDAPSDTKKRKAETPPEVTNAAAAPSKPKKKKTTS